MELSVWVLEFLYRLYPSFWYDSYYQEEKRVGLLVDADELQLVATVPGVVDPDVAVLVDAVGTDDPIVPKVLLRDGHLSAPTTPDFLEFVNLHTAN